MVNATMANNDDFGVELIKIELRKKERTQSIARGSISAFQRKKASVRFCSWGRDERWSVCACLRGQSLLRAETQGRAEKTPPDAARLPPKHCSSEKQPVPLYFICSAQSMKPKVSAPNQWMNAQKPFTAHLKAWQVATLVCPNKNRNVPNTRSNHKQCKLQLILFFPGRPQMLWSYKGRPAGLWKLSISPQQTWTPSFP